MVTVSIAAATICYLGSCYPALIGQDTPVGEFKFSHRPTSQRGYGGDLLVFKEDPKYVWAVHRVWLGSPKQRRLERLASNDPAERHITKGCINVMPEVYAELVNCCSDATVKIVP